MAQSMLEKAIQDFNQLKEMLPISSDDEARILDIIKREAPHCEHMRVYDFVDMCIHLVEHT